MIGVWTLDYPPKRFVGSEMMTHQLVKALQASGSVVRGATTGTRESWEFDGVQVTQNLAGCDVLITHADMPRVGWARRIRKQVAVCHNTEAGVELAIHVTRFDLVVCNSDVMRAHLEARDEQNYMVVRPPAPELGKISRGDAVTIVNLNENKVGRFWEVAAALPEQRFIAVLGGYGDQVLPVVVPANVEVLDHVSPELMWEKVWSQTRLLLAPSGRESWNMTAGEALAHGIPTVSTDLPGVRENLGDTATYLDRDDVDGWIAAVRSVRPSGVRARARFNRTRYLSDVEAFVEAVNTIGDDHHKAA